MSLPTAAVLATAALVLLYGVIYHGSLIVERRNSSRLHKPRFSAAVARCTYVAMILAIAVLLWGVPQDAYLMTHAGSAAIIAGWIVAVPSWLYLLIQLSRVLPTAIRLFPGWDATQADGAAFALFFATAVWAILAFAALGSIAA